MQIRAAVLTLTLLVAAPLALTFAGAQEDDSADKSAFVRFVEDTISTPDRKIELGAIDGALSSDVRLASITISDREGPWLRIDGVHLVWSRLALLTGTLDVESLDAERIAVSRKPLPPAGVDPAAAEGFALPDLPVAVKIGRIAAPEVTIAAPVLGQEARLSVDASGQLSDGSLNADLAIRRIDDKPGEATLKASYAADNKQLDVDLKISEPANGVIANLLNLPDRPSVRLTLTGSGPLSEFAADLDLATNDVSRLTGRTSISREGDAYRFGSSLSGDLAALVPADYALYLAGGASADLSGRVSDAGPVLIDRLALQAPVLSLRGSAAFGADFFPTALDIDGRLASRDGTLPLDGANGASRLGEGRFRLSLGADQSWSLDLVADHLQTPAFSAENLALNGGGVALDLADPDRRRIDVTLTGGSTALAFADPALTAAVGGDVAFSGTGRWSAGAPLVVEALKLATPTVEASFVGDVTGGTVKGRSTVTAPSLAPFSALAGRPLNGRIDLAAEGALTPLTGGFDLSLDGRAGDLAADLGRLDALTAGETRLSGAVVRDADGLALRNVRLANPALTLTADGRHSLKETDVTATLTLSDLNRIEPTARGPLGLLLTAKGGGGPLDVTARLASERLMLSGQALDGLGVDLAGKLDGTAFDGTISGGARLEGQPVTLRAGLRHGEDGSRLDGLDIRVVRTRLTSALALAAGGMATGSIDLDSPDLNDVAPFAGTDLAGRLSAAIRLEPSAGQQGATVSATAANVSAAGTRVGNARVEARIADLLGAPKIDGRFEAGSISTAAARIGSVSGRATSDGAATAFDLKAGGIGAPALTAAGIADLALVANGRLVGQRIELAAARLSGPGGLAATAKGTVPLSGTGLAVDAGADLPLALAQPLLAERGTRLSGTAKATAKVTGSLTQPAVTGRVTLAGGSLIDPATTMRLDAIEAALTLTGDRVVIERASAGLKGGGRVAAEGSIGLAGGQPVDIRLTASRARVTDGAVARADIGAKLSVSGSIAGGLRLSGNVDVARAEITVPDAGPSTDALLDVRHKNTPAAVAATLRRIDKVSGSGAGGGGAPAVALDLAINAPRQIFVRGRGIDAELGGSLRLGGTLAAVEPVGSFKLIRGRIVVIGQRISLDEGEATLTGDLNPYIALSATSSSDSIAVTAAVEGYADDPQIVLSSTPELPQDEILARFLFKRSIGDLSPLQIAQLAEAVTQLAGGGSGLIDRLRAQVGLDDLELTSDSEGNAAVKAGRYISEKVYLGVTAGTAGQSGVSVNLDITDDIKARAEATQSQSKIGVYFEREY